MRSSKTSLEVEDFIRQHVGTNVIDCGYIIDIIRIYDHLGVWLLKSQEEDARNEDVQCKFAKNWETKILTHDRSRRMAFEGTFAEPWPALPVVLENCIILGYNE